MQVLDQLSSVEHETFSLKGVENKILEKYLYDRIKGKDLDRKIVLSVDNKFSIDNLPNLDTYHSKYSSIINLRKANDINKLACFFGAVNEKLEMDGKFVTCLETSEYRKERLFKKFPPLINSCYYFFDYLAKRVAPKLPVIRNAYIFLTAGRNKVLTSVEVLGRLVYCGFEIIHTQKINNELYITAEKKEHKSNVVERNYGFFFKMSRTGLKGKPITVYKVRTMNAYSEYLQGYIYAQNQLDEGGKFKDDYRVNFIGNLFRKFWLDELPMIYNLIKGDIKLVGPRPLSNHYLSLYTATVAKKRFDFKPGLVPPYYVDMPKTLEEIMDSEMRYFDAYEKKPLLTDLTYFFKAVCNILFRKARSK
jgi:lipopolysaccharide/colanic/teichoic acid biosynthesis glycosyltransferase